jgi:hypothetical protein
VSSGARNEKNALKVKESRRSSEGRRCTPLSSVSGSPSNRCTLNEVAEEFQEIDGLGHKWGIQRARRMGVLHPFPQTGIFKITLNHILS